MMAGFGRFSVKLLAVTAALSLMGSGVAAADTGVVSEARVASVSLDKAAATNVVPDEDLRKCFNSALGYSSTDTRAVTAAQLQGITGTVKCGGGFGVYLSSLEGVQYLTNATELELWSIKPKVSLAPLEKLKNTKMTELVLGGTNTREKVKLPNLSGLPNLNRLSTYLPLSDISNVTKNTKLTSVTFDGAGLTNADVLAKMPSLEYIRLDGNNITNVSALVNMPNLQLLSVENNQLTYIPKRTAPNKFWEPYLYVTGNRITNFANIETWTPIPTGKQEQKLSASLVVSGGKTVVDISYLRSQNGSLPSRVYLAENGKPLTAYPASISNGGKTATFSQALKDGDWVYAQGSGVAIWLIQLKTVKVSSVAVSGSSSVQVGKSVSLKASVSPSNAANKAVSWKSSNTAVATVDANGKVTGKKAGTVTITATAKDGSGKSGSLKVSVLQPVTKVSVSGSSKVVAGYSITLKASVSPSNASNKAVSWKSSNTGIATVDANGKVTGKKAGTVTITATAKDGSKKYGSLKVAVSNPVKVTKVAVSGASKVVVGYSTTLKVSVAPSNATNKAVSWKSSNTGIATVDSKGKVTGKKAGTVTITATAKDGSKKYGSLKVAVSNPVKVTKVAVSGASKVVVGSSTTLKASVSPSNATNKAVSWKSSNTAVATVDSNGKVTGKKAGTVTVTATAKDGSKKYGSLKVAVSNPVKVTKVAVSGASKVSVGKSVQLKAVASPSNATNKAVSWKSSNTAVATVDASGKITGKKAGTVTITATAKDGSKKYGSLKVAVVQPVSSVKVSGSSSVMVGSSTTLKASVSPSNASNKAVSWKSSNTAVATVDASGKVTGRKAGTVTITATAKDGSGKAGSLKVSVVKTSWKRLEGAVALDTLKAVVNEEISSGVVKSGGTVVVATDAKFKDALAGNGIAGVYNAPILFTNPNKLSAQTRALLVQLKPKQILIMGSKYAITDSTANEMKAATGATVKRLEGFTAVETANAIAKDGKGKWGKEAVVVTETGYKDALSIGPYAYAKHAPIFYAKGGKTLTDSTLATMKELGITKVHIIGSRIAVPEAVEKQITKAGMTFDRIGGWDAIETSQKCAEFSIRQGMSVNRMGIATTTSYKDGLAAGPLLGRNNAVLVLTNSKNLSAIDAVYGKNKGKVSKGYIFGSKYAVADNVYNHVNK